MVNPFDVQAVPLAGYKGLAGDRVLYRRYLTDSSRQSGRYLHFQSNIKMEISFNHGD
jgi:hypothetical protein